MSFTHQVVYTKNMLDGPLQGSQLLAFQKCQSAEAAVRIACDLREAGVQRDLFTGATYTAHNVDIRSFEPELPELVENGGRGWDAYDAADFAYDLRGDN